jgi:hypothetical protein
MSGVSDNATDFDLKSQVLPNNHLVCLQRVTLANLTTAQTTAHVGVVIGNSIMWLETVALGSAATYYPMKNPVYIQSLKHVIVRFHGTTLKDRVYAAIYGYYVE